MHKLGKGVCLLVAGNAGYPPRVGRHRRKPRLASAIRCTGAPVLLMSASVRSSGCDGLDLVVPIRADEQEVSHLVVGDQMPEEVKGGGVQPLEVVEEQRERVLRPGEHAKESSKHHLETALLLLWRQFRHRRLLPDDEFKLGDEVHHELTVRPQRLTQGVPAPASHLRIALRQDLADEGLESLRQRGVRECRACIGRTCPTPMRPRGGTSALCSSLTTEDFPTPE